MASRRAAMALLGFLFGCVLMGVSVSATAAEPAFHAPGTQPFDGVGAAGDFEPPVHIYDEHRFGAATDCSGCHSSAASDATPFEPWLGGMMGNSARDPLFWAQLDLVNDDHNYRPEVLGMGDLCLRCHMPVGWLEGNSETDGAVAPADGETDERFDGMSFAQKDMHGVQCHFCHRLVDPLLEEDEENASEDWKNIVNPLALANVPEHPDYPFPMLPSTYGNGMFVADPKQLRRGPYSAAEISHGSHVDEEDEWENDVDENTFHPTADTTFYRSGNLCGTCHDVSNPIDVEDMTDDGIASDGTHAQHGFPIERTWTEWRHSKFYDDTDPGGIDGGEAQNCQSCHMSGPLNSTTYGSVCGNNEHPMDIHFHDMMGGNRFVPMVLKEMAERWLNAEGDHTAFRDALMDDDEGGADVGLYPQTTDTLFLGLDEDSLPTWYTQLEEASLRAERTLRRAAYVTVESDDDGDGIDELVVRVTNRTGHKLPTGYPEGRRMWLNVVFRGPEGQHWGESGYYSTEAELYHDQNLDGLAHDDLGAPAEAHHYDIIEYTDAAHDPMPAIGRPTKVWEGRAYFDASLDGFHDSDAEWDHKEFHFALVNARLWDNRIPPEGWIIEKYHENRALPLLDIDAEDDADPYQQNEWQGDYWEAGVWDGDLETIDALDEDDVGTHFDDTSYVYPQNDTDRAEVTLYYQTTSKEYIDTLRCDNPGAHADCQEHGTAPAVYNRGEVMYELWAADIKLPDTVDGEEIGKSAPFAMRSFVHAVADDDGDGLSNGWEIEHFGDESVSGYNDNPDGDGANNYQEFQAGTDPTEADVELRTPVNLVLVLDISGSMGDPAPGTATAKIDILKQSVELFLTTWSEYAVPEDRLAVVYFESDVTEFTPADAGGAAPLANAGPDGGPVSFVDYWQEALADVQSQTPLDYTAMGGGLYYALTGNYPEVDVPDVDGVLVATDLPKHVILFSNGMQNYSPMVTYGGADGALQIEDQDVSVVGVKGPSNQDPIGAPVAVEGAFVHSIGIGVSGSNAGGDSWHQMLADISGATNGKHNFITQAYDMEGVFLEDLVEALKGNTLSYVFEDSLAFSAEPVTIEIPINQSASKMSVIVSWAKQGNYSPETELLRSDGTPQDLSQITRYGDFFFIVTRYFGDPDESPEDYGTWKLKLTSPDRENMQVRVHVLVDETELHHTFNAASHLDVGHSLSVTMMAQQGDEILRRIDEASVTVVAPTKSVANALAASQHSLTSEQFAAADPDLTTSPYSQKLLAAYSDPTFTASLATEETTYDLLAAVPAVGDLTQSGVFSGNLFAAQVPGHYKLHFKMVGHTLSGEHFERKETRSLVVEADDIDRDLSRIRHTSENRDYVTLSPMDDYGNLLGPGNTSQVVIVEGSGNELRVLDDLDGSYRAELPDGFSVTGDALSVFVRGRELYTGTLQTDDGSVIEIAGINITTGSEAGGDVLTISGRNFLPGVIVRFGGVEAAEVVVISGTEIQATVPAGTGQVSIEVENPGGEAAQQNGAFTYQPVGVTPGTGLPILQGFGLAGGSYIGTAEPYAYVKIYKDGEAVASVNADSQGSFAVTPSEFTQVKDQEFVFAAESYDSNGNVTGHNTYVVNTRVGRNTGRSTAGRGDSENALELVGGASQTFRLVVNPGAVRVELYARLTGNVTPTFVVYGEAVPDALLTPDGGPDAAGWRKYTTTVVVPAGGGSTILTLAVSTPLETPVDAMVLIDDVSAVEP